VYLAACLRTGYVQKCTVTCCVQCNLNVYLQNKHKSKQRLQQSSIEHFIAAGAVMILAASPCDTHKCFAHMTNAERRELVPARILVTTTECSQTFCPNVHARAPRTWFTAKAKHATHFKTAAIVPTSVSLSFQFQKMAIVLSSPMWLI